MGEVFRLQVTSGPQVWFPSTAAAAGGSDPGSRCSSIPAALLPPRCLSPADAASLRRSEALSYCGSAHEYT